MLAVVMSTCNSIAEGYRGRRMAKMTSLAPDSVRDPISRG